MGGPGTPSPLRTKGLRTFEREGSHSAFLSFSGADTADKRSEVSIHLLFALRLFDSLVESRAIICPCKKMDACIG